MRINNKGFVSSGVLALIGALVVVGLLGWYLLGESQKVNDEYEAADQANSSLLKQGDDTTVETDTSTDSEVESQDDQVTTEEE